MPCLSFFGTTWLFWVVRGICLLGAITIIALLFRARRSPADGLTILQERLARGEISVEEFETKKALLSR